MSLLTTALAVPEPTIPMPGANEELPENPLRHSITLELNPPPPLPPPPPIPKAHHRVVLSPHEPEHNRGIDSTIVKQKYLPKDLTVAKAAGINHGSGKVVVAAVEGFESLDSVDNASVGIDGEKKSVYSRMLGAVGKMPGLEYVTKCFLFMRPGGQKARPKGDEDGEGVEPLQSEGKREETKRCRCCCCLKDCRCSSACFKSRVEWLVENIHEMAQLLAVSYLCLLVLAADFGMLAYSDDNIDEVWVSCFGAVTLLALVAAALLLVEPEDEDANKDSCFASCWRPRCSGGKERESLDVAHGEIGDFVESDVEDVERGGGDDTASQREPFDGDEDATESDDESDFQGASETEKENGTCNDWFSQKLDALANVLKANHNANRLFVVLEVVFDLMFAEKNLRRSVAGSPEYNISLSAIIAAGIALGCTLVDIALFYAYKEEIKYIRALRSTEPLRKTVEARAGSAEKMDESDRDEEEKVAIRAYGCHFLNLIYPTYNYAFIAALILSDLADILLLSRSAVVLQFEAKDVIIFVFLLSNVLVSEIFTGVANLFESFATQERLSEIDDGDERERKEKKLASAAALRTSLRRKANAQTAISGLVVIPLVLAITLYAGSSVTMEEVFVIVTPCLLLACVNLVVESVEFIGCDSVAHDSLLIKATGCMFAYVRVVQLIPRLLAGVWAVALGYTDVIAVRAGLGANADADVQRLVFDLYAVYMLLPLGVRFFSDVIRCLGLRSTIRDQGDFEGRALTDTDFLCIGRYAGIARRTARKDGSGSDDDETGEKGGTPVIQLEATFPTRMSLTLLLYGLTTWEATPYGGGVKHEAKQNRYPVQVTLDYNLIGLRGAKLLSRALATTSTVHSLRYVGTLARGSF